MVQILDKTFEPFLEQEEIQNIVSQMAKEIAQQIYVQLLNGLDKVSGLYNSSFQ